MQNREESISLSLKRVRSIGKIIQIVLFIGCGTFSLICVICGLVAIASQVVSDQFAFLENANAQSFALSAVSFGLLAIATKIGSDIIGSIRNDTTPFTHKQVSRLKWISLFLVLDVLIGAISSVSGSWFSVEGFIVGVAQNAASTLTLSINLGELVLSTALYSVSLIFQYGVLLEDYSDGFI